MITPPPATDNDYYLLANAKRKHYSQTRSGSQTPSLIVIHTAEAKNLTSGASRRERKAVDNTAENVAKYGATTSRQVSWHVTVDADSVVWCLPDRIKAWHVGRFNSQSLGIELACRAAVWAKPTTSPEWVNAILERAAGVVAYWCQTYDIPAERITRDQALRQVSGVIGHGDADPTRRTDPGRTFPWAQFLRLVREALAPPAPVKVSRGTSANTRGVSQSTGTLVTDGVPILTAAETTKLRELIADD